MRSISLLGRYGTRRIAAALGLIAFVAGCVTGKHSDSNLANYVATEGRFQRERREFQAPELRNALSSAALILKGKVVNVNGRVAASPNQHEVSTEQGWLAAAVQVERVLKGHYTSGTALVNNMGIRVGSGWRNPIEATNGQDCILVLDNDWELSRWCQTNIYRVVPGFEVK